MVESRPQFNKQLVLKDIAIDSIIPVQSQPRTQFEQQSIEELAQSIRTYGLLQPLIVSPTKTERVNIIAGERRWRAAKIVGLKKVPCIIRDMDEQAYLELALIENIQREALSAVDEAKAIKNLLHEHDYTHEQLATRLGKSRTTITNALRLLALPTKIIDDVHKNVISLRHALLLCALEDSKTQLKMLAIIVKKQLSVKQTEALIKSIKKTKKEKVLESSISPDMRYVCDQLKDYFSTKIKFNGDAQKGTIEISYYTHEDLARITEKILGNEKLV